MFVVVLGPLAALWGTGGAMPSEYSQRSSGKPAFYKLRAPPTTLDYLLVNHPGQTQDIPQRAVPWGEEEWFREGTQPLGCGGPAH